MAEPTYRSKLYSCEQIDQRLLQGYYDDFVETTGYSGTIGDFLNDVLTSINVSKDKVYTTLPNSVGVHNFPRWDSNHKYQKGHIIVYEYLLFQALTDHTSGNNFPEDNSLWEEVSISELIISLTGLVENFSISLENERKERIEQDSLLWNGIQNEADIRTVKDAELTQAIVDETSNRERTMEAMVRNIQATIDEEKHWREQGDTNTNTRIDGSNDVIIEHNKILYPLVLHIYGLDDLYEKGTTPMVKLYWIASRAGQQVNARIYIKKSTEESYYEVPENSTYYETYITDDTVFYIRAEYDYELLGESITIVTEKTLKADFVGVMRFGFNQSDSIDESGINTLAAQPFSTTPFGDYTLTTLTYGYIWLCVPTDMPYITKVTMNGFEVPMARPVIVGDYRCYRSRAQLVSGTYNITLS